MSGSIVSIVSDAACKVLVTDKNGVFGFQQHEILGQSVAKLAGSKSDFALFRTAIVNTLILQSSRLQLILYNRDGEEQKVVVSCEPLLSGGIYVGCLISFQYSQAVTLQNVLTGIRDSRFAQCLISSDSPHVIHMMNDEFASRIGCGRNEALGQNLPALISQVFCSDPRIWSLFFLAATDGIIRRSSISGLGGRPADLAAEGAADDDVICVPVVEEPNGRIRQVLVLFPPAQAAAPASRSPAALPSVLDLAAHESEPFAPGPVRLPALSCPAPAAPVPAAAPVPPPAPTTFADAIAGIAAARGATPPSPEARRLSFSSEPPSPPSTGTVLGPPPHGACEHLFGPIPAAIRPRRRQSAADGEEAPSPSAVVLTPAVLEALRGRPLPQAARAVGVSATAFKRACRKLGISRWAFRRGPARFRPGGQESTPPPAPAP